MVVFTETMRDLVSELAKFNGTVTTEFSEDRIIVTVVPCGSAEMHRTAARHAPSVLPPGGPERPAKPCFRRKPGRKSAKKYAVRDGRRVRLYDFAGETLSAAEWAARYGCSVKAVTQRFMRCGSPENRIRRSKYDRPGVARAKLAAAAESPE